MQIAVFIDCNRFFVAQIYHSLRHILEIHTDAAVLSLYIYESDMMLLKHRVSHAAYLYLDCIVIYPGDNRNMLLEACIYSSRNEFLHLLSAAYYRYL